MIRQLLAELVGNQGHADIARLVRAFDAGESLPQAELGRIMDALRVFLGEGSTDTHLREFGKRARIIGKQGRNEPTADEAERREAMVASYLMRKRALMATGMGARQAGAAAKRDICAKWHCSESKLQKDIVAFGTGARLLLRTLEWAERVNKS